MGFHGQLLGRALHAFARGPVAWYLKRLLGEAPHVVDGLGRNWQLPVGVRSRWVKRFLRAAVEGQVLSLGEGDGYRHVLLCAMPKSASLYLAELLSRALALRNVQIGFNQKGGSIYWPRLIAACFSRCHTVSHCHAAPIPDLLAMVETLGLRVVVLTRHLTEVLVSRRDMLVKDKWAGTILSPHAIARFMELPVDEQIDAIIDVFAPQFINFYAGWKAQAERLNPPPVFLTYEELFNDQVKVVSRVARELGLDVDTECVGASVEAIASEGGINRNKGMAGRGKQILQPRHFERLCRVGGELGCNDLGFLVG